MIAEHIELARRRLQNLEPDLPGAGALLRAELVALRHLDGMFGAARPAAVLDALEAAHQLLRVNPRALVRALTAWAVEAESADDGEPWTDAEAELLALVRRLRTVAP